MDSQRLLQDEDKEVKEYQHEVLPDYINAALLDQFPGVEEKSDLPPRYDNSLPSAPSRIEMGFFASVPSGNGACQPSAPSMPGDEFEPPKKVPSAPSL